MRKIGIRFRLFVGLSLILVVLFSSCQKAEVIPAATLKEQSWAKDIYTNMKDIYLWNDALPSTFNEKKYTKADDALTYLIGLKIDPQTNKAIDHYSFIDKIGNLSGEISGGTASDEVVKINGGDAVHPDADANGYLVTTSAGYTNMVNALFNSTSASFSFKRNDGTLLNVSLNAGSYSINSMLCDSIYTVGSSKVGYMVFNQFLGASSQTEITNTITKFQTNGVKNVIIDLRYNGGGSVETCEKFSSMLAPISANNKLMYSYKMNTTLTNYYTSQNYSLITNFAKTNTFEPTKIYFIVSGSTASASELLINVLRPYFPGNLFLIGSTTYGKPCGFWATPIGYTDTQTTTKEGYDLYAVSFEMTNANSEGGYYSGMTPATTKYPGIAAYDSFNLQWGNTNDDCLAQALYHIANSTFKAPGIAQKVKSNQPELKYSITNQFNGMIDFRKRIYK